MCYIRGFWETGAVTIAGHPLDPGPSQKVYNHSPDGFCWGYLGSGPAQLALAILMHYMHKNRAQALYQQFKRDVIAGLPQTDFELAESAVVDWIIEHDKVSG